MLYQASASVTNLATQIFNSIWYLKNLTSDNNANVFLQLELLRYFKTSCEKKEVTIQEQFCTNVFVNCTLDWER